MLPTLQTLEEYLANNAVSTVSIAVCKHLTDDVF